MNHTTITAHMAINTLMMRLIKAGVVTDDIKSSAIVKALKDNITDADGLVSLK